jgi:uncharacterized protein (TIGR00251 family)
VSRHDKRRDSDPPTAPPGSAGPPGLPGRRPAILLLHVQPRSARTEVVGRHGDAIKIRLRAAPADGAANAELLRFLAERLGVARSALRLVAGASSRRKRVAVTGGPPDPEARLLARPD